MTGKCPAPVAARRLATCCAHDNLRPLPDERERVSSKGACDRRARTKSERRPHHASEPNALWLSAETQRTSRPIVAHATYGTLPDERERVSSKGACDRCARTKSERRLHHASLFLKLRLVSARTKSERRLHHASFFLKLRLVYPARAMDLGSLIAFLAVLVRSGAGLLPATLGRDRDREIGGDQPRAWRGSCCSGR